MKIQSHLVDFRAVFSALFDPLNLMIPLKFRILAQHFSATYEISNFRATVRGILSWAMYEAGVSEGI